MIEGIDDVLNEFIGKVIGMSMGNEMYDEETESDLELLYTGKLIAIRGRWANIIQTGFEIERNLWINLDRVDYFTTDEPEFHLHKGKKVMPVQLAEQRGDAPDE